MHRKFIHMVATLGTVLLCAALSRECVAQLIRYDDFHSRNIDPSRWYGLQNYDPDLREAQRKIVREDRHGGLQLSHTAYSSMADDSGGSGGVFGLGFPDPDAITEVSFAVRVNRAEAVGCSTNDSLIVTDAEFRGSFFNTESTPISQVGNVTAVIDVERTPEHQGKSLTVSGFVTRCDDQYCSGQTPLSYQVLGSVVLGQEARLRLKWDHPHHQFIFQLNDEPEVSSPYTVSDTSPAVLPAKGIDLARVVPHCASGVRPHVSMEASFRDIRVNR